MSNSIEEVKAPTKQQTKRFPPRGITLSYQNEILRETAATEERIRNNIDKNLLLLKKPYNPIVGKPLGREESLIPFDRALRTKIESQQSELKFNTLNMTRNSPEKPIVRHDLDRMLYDVNDLVVEKMFPLEPYKDIAKQVKLEKFDNIGKTKSRVDSEYEIMMQLIEYKKKCLKNVSMNYSK